MYAYSSPATPGEKIEMEQAATLKAVREKAEKAKKDAEEAAKKAAASGS